MVLGTPRFLKFATVRAKKHAPPYNCSAISGLCNSYLTASECVWVPFYKDGLCVECNSISFLVNKQVVCCAVLEV
jgi:hypothetical protein